MLAMRHRLDRRVALPRELLLHPCKKARGLVFVEAFAGVRVRIMQLLAAWEQLVQSQTVYFR